MDISLDISALISALFWPAAVFGIVFILREPLTHLIKQLSERLSHATRFGIQALGLEATVQLEEGLDDAKQLAEEAEILRPQNGIPQPQKEYETTPQGLLTNEFQPLNEVAKNDPRSAIRAAWSIAEREIRQLAIENGARGTEVSSNKRVLKWLEESKTISHSIVSMASELYELRSKIVYYPQDIVRQEQATEYLKLAESLVRYLRSLEEQTSPR